MVGSVFFEFVDFEVFFKSDLVLHLCPLCRKFTEDVALLVQPTLRTDHDESA
jgi:hypothetical protein